jgi:hypothetical protein
VARPRQTSSGGGEGVFATSSKVFFGNNDIPVGRFGDQRKSTLGQDFSKLVFDDGEDVLSRSRGRHVDLVSEGYLFDRMMFFQYSFGFLSFFFSLFFIDQSVSIVDIGPCIVESCHHRWKRLICFPM